MALQMSRALSTYGAEGQTDRSLHHASACWGRCYVSAGRRAQRQRYRQRISPCASPSRSTPCAPWARTLSKSWLPRPPPWQWSCLAHHHRGLLGLVGGGSRLRHVEHHHVAILAWRALEYNDLTQGLLNRFYCDCHCFGRLLLRHNTTGGTQELGGPPPRRWWWPGLDLHHYLLARSAVRQSGQRTS